MGFVQVPAGGSPMTRIDQDEHAFLPLTTVLVSGAGEATTAPFLAVNSNFIEAAQVSLPDEDQETLSSSAPSM